MLQVAHRRCCCCLRWVSLASILVLLCRIYPYFRRCLQLDACIHALQSALHTFYSVYEIRFVFSSVQESPFQYTIHRAHKPDTMTPSPISCMSKVAALAISNPAVVAAATLGSSGLAMVAAPGIVAAGAVTALHAVGFGAGGIVGGQSMLTHKTTNIPAYHNTTGTVAASAQAAIGNVVAPSLFATLTSAGAGGYGVAAISVAAQWAGGTMAGVAGATGAWITARA